MEKANVITVREHGSLNNAGPVVVLHGGPGAPGSALGLAQELGQYFHVLEPLQRTAGNQPLTVTRHVSDLLKVLPEKAVIVGWSWGAMLGLSLAARHPDAPAALVLIGCGTYDQETRKMFHERMMQRLDEPQQRRLAALLRELESPRGSEKSTLAEVGRIVTQASTYAGLRDNREGGMIVDYLGHNQTWDDVLRLQEEKIEPQIFASIRVPTLMIHGAEDPHPGRETQERLGRYIPHLQYHELARCGHEPWNEKYAKQAFMSLLTGWIARYAGEPKGE
ncbi:MAG: alpha/beta hydrolase [Deltaproteobacteria bacterium]|nr:alpha/beta hydrolase [Deltaproteobacteria bacterium]